MHFPEKGQPELLDAIEIVEERGFSDVSTGMRIYAAKNEVPTKDKLRGLLERVERE